MAPRDPMLDWWLSSLSGASNHALAAAIAWHARLMVLAWGVLIPVGVLWARFWKVAPGQDWPRELDDKRWWHAHRTLQIAGVLISIAALALVQDRSATSPIAAVHHVVGWTLAAAGAWQLVHGFARGSKGGPTAASLRGDHFDMTAWRVVFERVHKSLGWIAVLLAIVALGTGLAAADAPRWMAALLASWWIVLGAAFIRWQRAGRALDTYQAIWGPDPALPGAARPPIGWGVRRISAATTDGGKR